MAVKYAQNWLDELLRRGINPTLDLDQIRVPEVVAADEQGRIKIEALKAALKSGSVPTILVLQAGNIHSGAFEPS